MTNTHTFHFLSCSSIVSWAGSELHFVEGNDNLPYVEKDAAFWYFGRYEDGYHLIMTSSKEI